MKNMHRKKEVSENKRGCLERKRKPTEKELKKSKER
jgi:hypothetical protein